MVGPIYTYDSVATVGGWGVFDNISYHPLYANSAAYIDWAMPDADDSSPGTESKLFWKLVVFPSINRDVLTDK